MKKLSIILTLLFLALSASAQGFTGGIRASVVNRAGREAIPGATVEVSKAGKVIASVKTGSDGKFLVEGLENGSYAIAVKAEGFTEAIVNAAVEDGLVRDLMFVTMSQNQIVQEVDDSNFADLDLQDTGYSDSPTILFNSNDPFTNIVAYGFSAIRFKSRGYNSETQQVMLAGVPMNDAITGYSPYSLWSGLNEAMRSKDTYNGLDASDSYIGGYNGVTNISGVASSVRPGLRFSVLSNSALYRLRLMANYASGRLDNGWAYAFNASVRLGGNDWVKGVYYRSFSLYAGAEKRFDAANNLAFFAFAAPGERGAQNASTQEVYDLVGDNMYNSNWGYQNGKVRNSRVKSSFEPVFGVKYDYTPSTELQAHATLLWRTGSNGSTALDWYDASDPRPDYYRNLPSYFYMEDEDYNKTNEAKAAYATEMWSHNISAYQNYQHLDWDRLYNVNYNNPDGRSKYALEERHVDQNDINLAANAKWLASSNLTVMGGLNGRVNRTENYKKMNDLLGGDYFLNIDSFAERDFAANEAKLQNDLDYYLEHGKQAEKITRGGKYGYDYLAQIRKIGAWTSAAYSVNGFTASGAVSLGYDAFWREGLVRKGLFAGTQEEVDAINSKYGTDLEYNGQTSKGKSEVASFLTWSAKAGAAYVLKGGHRFAVNAGYFNDAPTFSKAFISARTRNTMVDGLTTVKTLSFDASYQYSNNGYNVKLTGYYTTIKDQTDVMSFYDDSQNSFTNFAMTGIDERHTGLELGAKLPLPVKGLSLSGALSLGEYVYTSNPRMVQTVDNSAETVREGTVTYWQSHPIYKSYVDDSGNTIYEKDLDGNLVVSGEKKHHVAGSPELAAELALKYNINYWFFELNGQYFAHSYLSMNPLYRTESACKGSESDPTIVDYMAAQEEFAPVYLMNLSIGKSWYIRRSYQIGFSLSANNILNNRNVKTGGYEQTRLISSYGKDRYYKFDSKYFYMQGANYMLNIYFKF